MTDVKREISLKKYLRILNDARNNFFLVSILVTVIALNRDETSSNRSSDSHCLSVVLVTFHGHDRGRQNGNFPVENATENKKFL